MRYLAALFILTGALLSSAPARATLFVYTVPGSVVADSPNMDENHIFGPSLGTEFSARFIVDDALPLAIYEQGASGSSAKGGLQYAIGSQRPVTATLTIGAAGHAISTGNSLVTATYDPTQDEFVGYYDSRKDLGIIDKQSALHELQLSARYDSEYRCCYPYPLYLYQAAYDTLDFTLHSSALTDPHFQQVGTFALDEATSSGDYAFSQQLDAGQPGLFTQIALQPRVLTVAQAVPEPASWLMLIAGVGAVGLAMRRRGGYRPINA